MGGRVFVQSNYDLLIVTLDTHCFLEKGMNLLELSLQFLYLGFRKPLCIRQMVQFFALVKD